MFKNFIRILIVLITIIIFSISYVSIFGIKTNKFNETIKSRYNNEYLITKTKIDNLRKISLKKLIPSFIFLNLPSEKKIVRFKITDGEGKWTIPVESRMTRTMYSCNDYKGTTERENVFLPLNSDAVMVVSY